MTLKQWNEMKVWIAPLTALILWVISIICFVFGLSFKNPILVAGYDLTLYIAFAIAMCNTAIQLIGNGNTEKDDSGVFVWIWRASYILGVASNTNALMQMVGISNIVLEWMVALSLGAIIEIAPEKLIMIWLQSVKFGAMLKKAEENKKNEEGRKHQNPNHPFHPVPAPYNVTFPPVNDALKGFQKREALERQHNQQKKQHHYRGE